MVYKGKFKNNYYLIHYDLMVKLYSYYIQRDCLGFHGLSGDRYDLLESNRIAEMVVGFFVSDPNNVVKNMVGIFGESIKRTLFFKIVERNEELFNSGLYYFPIRKEEENIESEDIIEQLRFINVLCVSNDRNGYRTDTNKVYKIDEMKKFLI